MADATDMAANPAPLKDVGVTRSYVAGVGFLTAAGVLWSLNGALIKLTFDEGRGPNGVVIAFYRSLFAGLVLLPLARGKWSTLRPKPREPLANRAAGTTNPGSDRAWVLPLRPAAICCVVFFTLMTVCFVVANTKTEAANAIILQYTSTFWIFGLSPWLLKEFPRRNEFVILLLAIVGVAIIFSGDLSTSLVGLLNALAAGLFFALLTLMIRQMRDSNSAAVTVLNNLGSALLILPFVLLFADVSLSMRSLVLLMIMGVVQFGIPYYLYSLGLGAVPAYQASLITMSEPILVPVWTYLAVGEAVPIQTVIGGAIIMTALVWFVLVIRRAHLRRAVLDEVAVTAEKET